MYDLCLVTRYLHGTSPGRRKELFTSTPLGVLMLAATVRDAGLSVKLADLNELAGRSLDSKGGANFSEAVAEELAAIDTDTFGFSTISSSFPLTVLSAVALKRLRPEANILLGGPQASAVAVEAMRKYPQVDFVLRGEADLTLPILLDALRDRESHSLSSIPGLVWRTASGAIRASRPPEPVPDLNALPLPAYDLWPGEDEPVPAVEIGRGCPFNCTFCSTSGFFSRKSRQKSPALLVQEVELLADRYGAKRLAFVHDMIASDRAWLVEFCRGLRASKRGPSEWVSSLRADRVDESLLTEMRSAGCTEMLFGIEVGSRNMQKAIRKRIRIDRVPALAEVCGKLGICATFSFITGFPEETADDVRATTRLMLDVFRQPLAKMRLALLTPLSGSTLEQEQRGNLLFDATSSPYLSASAALDAGAEQAIRSAPELYPNFYGIRTNCIDRADAQELDYFCGFLVPYFRWPCIALHSLGLSAYDLFQAWLDQHRARGLTRERDYYWSFDACRALRDLIVEIVEQRYPAALDAMKTLLSARLYEEKDVRQIMETGPRGHARVARLSDLPALAPGYLFRDCPGDYRSIVQGLQAGAGPESASANASGLLFSCGTGEHGRPTIRREVLSPLKRAILADGDGTWSIRHIADSLAGRFPSAPTSQHVRFAIDYLVGSGVLVLRRQVGRQAAGESRISIGDLPTG